MTEFLRQLERPEIILMVSALLIILMMLLAIMLRISRRDGENSHQLSLLREDMNEQLKSALKQADQQLEHNRADARSSMEQLNDGIAKAITASGRAQISAFDEYSANTRRSSEAEAQRAREFSADVQRRMDALDNHIQQSNAEQLRRMENMRIEIVRDTVGAIDARLEEVLCEMSAQLERLTGEIGRLSGAADEMQRLRDAMDARLEDGLECGQMDALFAGILSPGRCVRHFEIGTGSGHFADYAILLPDDSGQMLYLPVDAGFPAAEFAGEFTANMRRELSVRIDERAHKISSALIKPGLTTDFALMLIPSELVSGRVSALEIMQRVQQDMRVIPVGPASLMAMVRALEGGMNALAMQRHSQEVEQLLSEVRIELKRFSKIVSQNADNAHIIDGHNSVAPNVRQKNDMLADSNTQSITAESAPRKPVGSTTRQISTPDTASSAPIRRATPDNRGMRAPNSDVDIWS